MPPPAHQIPSFSLLPRLGYAGLAPFVLLAALLWVAPSHLRPWLALALASYAAVIVTFLGGIYWGFGGNISGAESQVARRFHLIWGVTPSLVAWLALLMPAHVGLLILALLLVVCYWVDYKSYPAAGWSAWLPMRFKLTLVATVSCLIGAARLVV